MLNIFLDLRHLIDLGIAGKSCWNNFLLTIHVANGGMRDVIATAIPLLSTWPSEGKHCKQHYYRYTGTQLHMYWQVDTITGVFTPALGSVWLSCWYYDNIYKPWTWVGTWHDMHKPVQFRIKVQNDVQDSEASWVTLIKKTHWAKYSRVDVVRPM